jgi:Helix-turn-helix domain
MAFIARTWQRPSTCACGRVPKAEVSRAPNACSHKQAEANCAAGRRAADFSRIRRANLGRFTIDRLMTILSRLGQEVEVSVNVHPRPTHSAEPETAPALR